MVDDIVDDMIVKPQEIIETDREVWNDILKLQLDGVMMHIAMFEFFLQHDVPGYVKMHKHHAEEEFDKYLHVTGDYVDAYKTIPMITNTTAPILDITGECKEELMLKGVCKYKEWEKDVCRKLNDYKKRLRDGAEHVDYLIDSVKQEMKYINLMENDLLDGNVEELDEWLNKKYGDA